VWTARDAYEIKLRLFPDGLDWRYRNTTAATYDLPNRFSLLFYTADKNYSTRPARFPSRRQFVYCFFRFYFFFCNRLAPTKLAGSHKIREHVASPGTSRFRYWAPRAFLFISGNLDRNVLYTFTRSYKLASSTVVVFPPSFAVIADNSYGRWLNRVTVSAFAGGWSFFVENSHTTSTWITNK